MSYEAESSKTASYDSLPLKDMVEAEMPFLEPKRRYPNRRWYQYFSLWLRVAEAMLFVGLLALVVLGYLRKPSDDECSRQLSTWSPALDAVEYSTFNYKGDFGQESIYRGPPTPERDAAWDYLTRDHGINIPLDKVPLLNKSTEVDWDLSPPEFGGGPVALLEVFHQLHCLNVLRKWTYIEWYDPIPDEFTGPEYLQRMHMDHCIEVLRINLMCTADVTPILAVVDETATLGKKADFNTFHKCRNFDRIHQWMEDNTAVQ